MRHADYMRRCFHLARKGFRHTDQNPMVGAVLVYKNRIIGEGYHEAYGGPHAEVNCFQNVRQEDEKLIRKATMYVSLEPCSFHGKTPACSTLIIKKNPAAVVVGCLDPNPKVSGKGIEALRQNNIPVQSGILEDEAKSLIKKFKINLFQKRPFIALKWAQSKFGYAGLPDQSVWFTNQYSKVKAHQLRGQFEGILIGANSVILDNPKLDNRLGTGPSPQKIIIDPRARVPFNSQLLNHGEHAIVISKEAATNTNSSSYKWVQISNDSWNWDTIFRRIFQEGITSVLVEGGPTLQTTIIKEGLWDEAHVLSSKHPLQHGIRAPKVEGRRLDHVTLADDEYFHIAKE